MTGVNPSNGAVSQPSVSHIKFTFSSPVDTSARFLSGLPIGLLDINGSAVSRVNGWTVSPDLSRITLNVSNPDSSDITWVVTGARSLTGERLCNPFALNYSTRQIPGLYEVSGEAGRIILTKGDDCSNLPEIIATLLDAPFDQGGKVVAASIVTIWEYAIQGVRPGTYWPTFFFDSNADGNIVPFFDRPGEMWAEVAVYDPDFDGKADSIVVVNSDVSGIGSMFVGGSIGEPESVPAGLRLKAVYPNPFFDIITVDFELVYPSAVTISIIDVIGRIRRVRKPGVLPIGNHSLELNAENYPTGVYLLVLRAGSTRVVRSVMHIRRQRLRSPRAMSSS